MSAMPKISIPIRTLDGVCPSIVRANAHLISQNKIMLDSANTDEEKTNILKNLWRTEFNATIIDDWQEVEFSQAHDKTLFLLQWG